MIDSGTVQFTAPDGSLRQAPICELELELEQGEASDLLTLACELAQTLPLMPADVSKAERGYRLYLDLPLRPTHAEVSTLSADQGVVEAFRDRAYACIRQWQANVADALALAAAQPQPKGQVAVELNHCQAPQALHQRLGEGGQARANFHHRLAGQRRDGAHDGFDDAAVRQKMLAEALAGNVFHAVAIFTAVLRGIRRRPGPATPASRW